MRYFYLSENAFTHEPIVRIITNNKMNKEFSRCKVIPDIAHALVNLHAIGIENCVSYDQIKDELVNMNQIDNIEQIDNQNTNE